MREESHEGRLAKLAADYLAAHVEVERAERERNEAERRVRDCVDARNRAATELHTSVGQKIPVRNFVVDGRLVRVKYIRPDGDLTPYRRVTVEELIR